MARTNPANVGDADDEPAVESLGEAELAASAEAEDDDEEAPDAGADAMRGGGACSDKAFGMAMGSMLGGEPPGWVDASGSPMGRAFTGPWFCRRSVQNKEDRFPWRRAEESGDQSGTSQAARFAGCPARISRGD